MDVDECNKQSTLLKCVEIRRRCLQKFLDFSRAFQIEIEMKDLESDDIRVVNFMNRRNSIMKILLKNDSRINKILKIENGSEIVKAELKKQSELIIDFQKIDRSIIDKIIFINKSLQSEMSNFEMNEIKIKKFKSKWVATLGDQLDGLI